MRHLDTRKSHNPPISSAQRSFPGRNIQEDEIVQRTGEFCSLIFVTSRAFPWRGEIPGLFCAPASSHGVIGSSATVLSITEPFHRSFSIHIWAPRNPSCCSCVDIVQPTYIWAGSASVVAPSFSTTTRGSREGRFTAKQFKTIDTSIQQELLPNSHKRRTFPNDTGGTKHSLQFSAVRSSTHVPRVRNRSCLRRAPAQQPSPRLCHASKMGLPFGPEERSSSPVIVL